MREVGDINNDKVEEIRAATREANETLQDLRLVLKEFRDERQAIAKLLEGVPERLVKEHIEEAVIAGLAIMGQQIKEAMDSSVAKVGREFDRLEAIFTGTDNTSKRTGKPTLEELIRSHPNSKGVPS